MRGYRTLATRVAVALAIVALTPAVALLQAAAPAVPSGPSPATAATAVATSTSLTWAASPDARYVRCGVRHDQHAAARVGQSSRDVLYAASGARLFEEVLLADHGEGRGRIHGWPGVVVHDDCGATGGARRSAACERRDGGRNNHNVQVGGISPCDFGTMWRSARAIRQRSSRPVKPSGRINRQRHWPTRRPTTGRSRRKVPAVPRPGRCGRSRRLRRHPRCPVVHRRRVPRLESRHPPH